MEAQNPQTAPAQGGTATGFTQGRLLEPLNQSQLQELNTHRRKAASVEAGDGYCAVMLAGTAGWTSLQISNFLGLSDQSIQAWTSAYRSGGIGGLAGLPQPSYTNPR